MTLIFLRPGLFGRADQGLTVQNNYAVLVFTDGLQPNPVFVGHDFRHLYRSGYGIADMYRCCEIKRLPDINSSGAGEPRTQDGGNKSSRKHSVGDSGFKKRFFGIGLIDVGWIKIAGHTGIQIDIRFGNSFGKFGSVSKVEFVDGFSDHGRSFQKRWHTRFASIQSSRHAFD